MQIPPERAGRELSFQFIRPPDHRYTFHSTLLEADDRHIVVTHRAYPSKPLYYRDQEVMAAGYDVIWFLFKDEPFDVGRFYRPDGTWTGYYVDILEPVRWQGTNADTLQPIVDLFLDLWIAPDGEHMVLDEDEFEDAKAKGYLSGDQVAHAQETLQRLVASVMQNTFPQDVVKNFRL